MSRLCFTEIDECSDGFARACYSDTSNSQPLTKGSKPKCHRLCFRDLLNKLARPTASS